MACNAARVGSESKGEGEMNHSDIFNALRTRLEATASAPPIVWGENSPGVYDTDALAYLTPAAPFWLAYFTNTPPERLGLSKSHTMIVRLVVAIFVTPGTFETQAEAYAQSILDQFPTDLPLTAGNGKVTVSAMGNPQPGKMDGPHFRKNVSIPCRVIFQRSV